MRQSEPQVWCVTRWLCDGFEPLFTSCGHVHPVVLELLPNGSVQPTGPVNPHLPLAVISGSSEARFSSFIATLATCDRAPPRSSRCRDFVGECDRRAAGSRICTLELVPRGATASDGTAGPVGHAVVRHVPRFGSLMLQPTRSTIPATAETLQVRTWDGGNWIWNAAPIMAFYGYFFAPRASQNDLDGPKP